MGYFSNLIAAFTGEPIAHICEFMAPVDGYQRCRICGIMKPLPLVPEIKCEHVFKDELVDGKQQCSKCNILVPVAVQENPACSHVFKEELDDGYMVCSLCNERVTLPVKDCQHEWVTDSELKGYLVCNVCGDRKSLPPKEELCEHEYNKEVFSISQEGGPVTGKLYIMTCLKCGDVKSKIVSIK